MDEPIGDHREETIQDKSVDLPVIPEEVTGSKKKKAPVVDLEMISEDPPEKTDLQPRKRTKKVTGAQATASVQAAAAAAAEHPLLSGSFTQDFTSSQVRHFTEHCFSLGSGSILGFLGSDSKGIDQAACSQAQPTTQLEVVPTIALIPSGKAKKKAPVAAQSSREQSSKGAGVDNLPQERGSRLCPRGRRTSGGC